MLENNNTEPQLRLDRLITSIREYLFLPENEVEHVVVGLAVAVSKQLVYEEPLWVLYIGASGSGKTEAIKVLDGVSDARVDDLTRAGLLSWHQHGKRSQPTGLLTKIPREAFVTISDFSSVVTMGDREARARMFGILRVVYDGRVRRSLGGEPTSEGAGTLEWEGHLTLLAGATPAIDAHVSHEAALGERWLSYRLPESPRARSRARARFAVGRREVEGKREQARALAADIVRASRGRIPKDLSDQATERLLDAATFAATARTGVVFEGQGRTRVIVETPTPEEPTRFAQQLHRLARCLIALGLSEEIAAGIATKTAIDSIPPTRERTIRALLDAGQAGAGVSDVHRALGRGNRWAVLWQLDCLEAVGMVDIEGPPRDEDPHAHRTYRLRDEWLQWTEKLYESVASHSLFLSVKDSESERGGSGLHIRTVPEDAQQRLDAGTDA